jgi:hypothetical protein
LHTISDFLGNEPSIPKVIFFSSKPTTPNYYKAIATNFKQSFKFGVVSSSEEVFSVILFLVTFYPFFSHHNHISQINSNFKDNMD